MLIHGANVSAGLSIFVVCMISVILPFHNAGEQLAQSIQSVVEQTFSDWELILVNNNSTDVSREIAEDFTTTLPEKVRLVTEPKQGVVYAMNAGLGHTRGEWVARLDADDTWLPTKLARQVDYCKKYPEAKVVATQVRFNTSLEHAEGLNTYVDWSNSIYTASAINKSIFTEAPLVNPSLLFRKELIDEYGPYREGDFPEDYEMLLRWHSHGVEMAKVPEKLMDWNDSAQRLTRTHAAYTQDAFNRVKCAYLAKWLRKSGKAANVWIWGAGRKTRKKVKELERHGIDIKGFIDLREDKTSVKPCLHYKSVQTGFEGFVISFVSNRGKGEEVRQYLLGESFKELEHFVIAG